MIKWIKRFLFGLTGILLIIQIPVFNPKKNYADTEQTQEITKRFDVPMDIQMDLYTACYDCHSNYTESYPWYYSIQPVSWWIAHHINEGKKELNFSEFASYSSGRVIKKFKEINEVMTDKSMPLKSYLLMHKEAKLTDEQYRDIAEWAKGMHDQLTAESNALQEKNN
ncbi:MAG: heme-binding domain-containing protein [Bacteroidia bacterium]|nr:heme-binding domain-containing protein [Bacteroidia bacterium]MCZ2278066.1 heme-binding domain-containing protein [Bacteroidia bacterium]